MLSCICLSVEAPAEQCDTPGRFETVAIGPAGLARIRISGGEHRSTALGQICQMSATHRLHDDDWFAVGRSHFHAARRLGDRVVPIQIVHLQLHEVHLGCAVRTSSSVPGPSCMEKPTTHEPVGLAFAT